MFESDSPAVPANVQPATSLGMAVAANGQQQNYGVRTTTGTTTTAQHFQITRWPGSLRNAGVLILSDDEDDDEDEDDEDEDER